MTRDAALRRLRDQAGPICRDTYAHASGGVCLEHGGDACLVMPVPLLHRGDARVAVLEAALRRIAGFQSRYGPSDEAVIARVTLGGAA